MKHYSLLLSCLVGFQVAQAQFVDFGSEYQIQKGSFAAVDIDLDGDLDVIFSGENSGKEQGAIMINDGHGNFTLQGGERVIKIGRGGNINVGDINGDGYPDLIFAGWDIADANTVGIALNDGTGIFTLADREKYPVNRAAKVVSAGFADFNLDGLLDYYFFANGAGNCVIYFQQQDGSFQASTESFGSYNFNEPEVTVVDYDNDGTPDIFITAALNDLRYSALFKNDGFGGFSEFEGVDIFRKKANGSSSWADFNGDGYLDLLLNGDGWLDSGENSDAIVRIYKNLVGNSIDVAYTFDAYRQNSIGNGSVPVDWNNDGKLDFFIAGWNDITKKQETALYIGENPSGFTFSKSPLTETLFPGTSEQALRVADLNGDNKVDLLFCGFSGGTGDLKRRAAGYVLNPTEKASVLPDAPANLNAVIDEGEELTITFTWDVPQSEKGKYGTSYNLALKNLNTGKWLYNPLAFVGGPKNGLRQVGGQMGNVYLNKEFYLYNLPAGDYEWTVQAINGAYLGGAFAQAKQFTIGTSAAITNTNTYHPSIIVVDKTIRIKGESGTQFVNIYDMSGVLINKTSFENEVLIQMDYSGIYIIEVLKADESIYREKVSL